MHAGGVMTSLQAMTAERTLARCQSDTELAEAIARYRSALGERVLILAHHYQRDEIVRHADYVGDSLRLSMRAAAAARERHVRWIIFCGVGFMAETADVLTPEHIEVILPNAAARCPMAEMAQEDEVREALELLAPGGRHNWPTPFTPIAYVNSTAAVKAIVGEHGGACCTSANAETVMRWALCGGDRTQGGGTGKGNDSAQRGRVLFLPDEHLGRNVCARLGVAADEQALWDPMRQHVGPPPEHLRATRVYHWKGYCYVHRRFRSEDVRAMREDAQRRGIALRVVAHPECVAEVVNQCDATASTERMVEMLDAAEPGTHWALATEVHLVSRVARRAAARGVDVRIVGRSGMAGPICGAMLQIAPMDLLHVLERLNAGEPVNVVRVRPEVREGARLALERMLRMA